MKKQLLILIVGMLLIIPMIHADAQLKTHNQQKMFLDEKNNAFVIDQMQTTSDHVVIIENDFTFAQSFVPQRSPLAKIRLLAGVNTEDPASGDLHVYITDDLNGNVLTEGVIEENDLYATVLWVNCEFEDISVNVGEEYYIVVTTEDMSESGEYYWYCASNKDHDRYEPGNAWYLFDDQETWQNLSDESDSYVDFCFKTYSYSDNIPDLQVDGVLSWDDCTPGGMVTDTIIINNVGDENSLLSWEIISYPSWGNWTITPLKGSDLTPGDEGITVVINVTVPEEKNSDFDGVVTIANQDDPEDTSTLSVSLSTPQNKQTKPIYRLIKELFQKYFFFPFYL